MDLIYLACPYSHKNPKVRQRRFRAVTGASLELMKRGHLVFSPITHSHPIATLKGNKFKSDFNAWKEFDFRMLSVCDSLYVLCLPGWTSSIGVQEEVKMAGKMGKVVELVFPSELGLTF